MSNKLPGSGEWGVDLVKRPSPVIAAFACLNQVPLVCVENELNIIFIVITGQQQSSIQTPLLPGTWYLFKNHIIASTADLK